MFAQTKYHQFDFMVGYNLQKQYILKRTPLLLGVGKEIFIKKVILLGYIKIESDFNNWLTSGSGIRLCYTNKYYQQNLYLFMDTYFPFQNYKHKKEQNLGPVSARMGVGYVTKKINKIDFGLGFSENWKPFLDIEYRTSFNIRTNKKRKKYKCPPLQ